MFLSNKFSVGAAVTCSDSRMPLRLVHLEVPLWLFSKQAAEMVPVQALFLMKSYLDTSRNSSAHLVWSKCNLMMSLRHLDQIKEFFELRTKTW